jgi:hypothetical protein
MLSLSNHHVYGVASMLRLIQTVTWCVVRRYVRAIVQHTHVRLFCVSGTRTCAQHVVWPPFHTVHSGIHTAHHSWQEDFSSTVFEEEFLEEKSSYQLYRTHIHGSSTSTVNSDTKEVCNLRDFAVQHHVRELVIRSSIAHQTHCQATSAQKIYESSPKNVRAIVRYVWPVPAHTRNVQTMDRRSLQPTAVIWRRQLASRRRQTDAVDCTNDAVWPTRTRVSSTRAQQATEERLCLPACTVVRRRRVACHRLDHRHRRRVDTRPACNRLHRRPRLAVARRLLAHRVICRHRCYANWPT